MEAGKNNCAACGKLIRLCSGLSYFPADVEVRKLLVERLHRLSRNHEHAKGMIEKWLDEQAEAPKVSDLVSLSHEVDSNRESLPAGCDICNGQNWVVTDRGARRCTECARGRQLSDLDAARELERTGQYAARSSHYGGRSQSVGESA